MPSTGYTSLKGVTDIGKSLLNNQLEHGIIAYFQWAILGTGGYYNYSDGTDHYGNNPAQLRMVGSSEDPRYANGRVWEGRRIDWVWESGVGYSGTQPISISGVVVNSTFYASDVTGAYAHYVDYPNGRVIFDSAIATSSTVKCNHSARYVHITTADADWFKRILTNSHLDQGFNISGSGERTLIGDSRVQLPAIVVEAVPNRSFEPLQLGGGQKIYQDVVFTVIAESSWQRNNLIDIISLQSDKTIYIYNLNEVLENDAWPLDYRNAKVNNNQYTDLIDSYTYKKCRFEKMRVVETGMINNYLFGGQVRATIYLEMADLV